MVSRCPARSQYPAGRIGTHAYHLHIWQDLSQVYMRALASKLIGDDLNSKYLCCVFMETVEAIPIICRAFVKDFDFNVLPYETSMNPQGKKQIAHVTFKRLVSSAVVEMTLSYEDSGDWEDYFEELVIAGDTADQLIENINQEAAKAWEH